MKNNVSAIDNLHFANLDFPTQEERNKFKTWEFVEEINAAVDMGKWEKKSVPFFPCGEVAGSTTPYNYINKEAIEWFKTSNEEDLLMINKEKNAFESWYSYHFNDIKNYL